MENDNYDYEDGLNTGYSIAVDEIMELFDKSDGALQADLESWLTGNGAL